MKQIFIILSIILNLFYIEVIVENKSERKYFLEKTLPYLIAISIGSIIGVLIDYLIVKYKKEYLRKYIVLLILFSLIFFGLYIRYKIYKRYNELDYTEPSPGEAPSLPSEKINMERKKDMKNEYSFELPNYSEKYLKTAGRSIDESLGLPNKYEM